MMIYYVYHLIWSEIETLRTYFSEDLQPDFIRILEILKDKKVIDCQTIELKENEYYKDLMYTLETYYTITEDSIKNDC